MKDAIDKGGGARSTGKMGGMSSRDNLGLFKKRLTSNKTPSANRLKC